MGRSEEKNKKKQQTQLVITFTEDPVSTGVYFTCLHPLKFSSALAGQHRHGRVRTANQEVHGLQSSATYRTLKLHKAACFCAVTV